MHKPWSVWSLSAALHFAPNSNIWSLFTGMAHRPAARSSVCQCASDPFQLELHSFLFKFEICTCMLDCAPLVFWLEVSPPALIICFTLASTILSPPRSCVLIGGSPVNCNVIGVVKWDENDLLPSANGCHYSCMLRAKHTRACTHSLCSMFRCPTMFLHIFVWLHRT